MVKITYGSHILATETKNIIRELTIRNDLCLKCVSLEISRFLQSGVKKCNAYHHCIIFPVNFCDEYGGTTRIQEFINDPNCDKVKQ